MADEPSSTQTGRCVYCNRDVTREDSDDTWKTATGGWKCPNHPRAPHSRITPHQVA